jgi:hypothetical protein
MEARREFTKKPVELRKFVRTERWWELEKHRSHPIPQVIEKIQKGTRVTTGIRQSSLVADQTWELEAELEAIGCVAKPPVDGIE